LGKTAETEKIKLRATFLNNSAVGIVVAGIILPLLALLRTPEIVMGEPSSIEDIIGIVLGIIALAVAIWYLVGCTRAHLENSTN
jgi:hypothetical protein